MIDLSDRRCIYALVDPRDGRTRYIGAAADPFARLHSHLATAVMNRPITGDRGKTARVEWLYDLLMNDGKTPILEILDVGTVDWEEREREFIADYRERGEPLLNLGRGGRGNSAKPTPERVELHRQYMTGRKHTPETREKMRVSRLAYLERTRHGVDR